MNNTPSRQREIARSGLELQYPTQQLAQLKKFAFFVCTAICVGCSSKKATYPVRGVVKVDGAPLSGGRILFQPSDRSTPAARGVIANDGTYQLGTFTSDDGACAGKYVVTVNPEVPSSALDDAAAVARYRSKINYRYQNPKTSPLEFAVKDDGSENRVDISVESSRPLRR